MATKFRATPPNSPAVGGIVTAVGATASLTLDAPDGRTGITVELDPENPPPVVQRVEEGTLDDLRAGARWHFLRRMVVLSRVSMRCSSRRPDRGHHVLRAAFEEGDHVLDRVDVECFESLWCGVRDVQVRTTLSNSRMG